jgi:propionate CoA-transferase
VEDVQHLAEYLENFLDPIGQKVRVIVNYDNFNLSPVAEDAFFEMVRRHEEQYFISATRYSSNAFFRHKLGQQFARANLEQRIYRSFDEAHDKLK